MVCHMQNLKKQILVYCLKIIFVDLMPEKPKGDLRKVVANLGPTCTSSSLEAKDTRMFPKNQMWIL